MTARLVGQSAASWRRLDHAPAGIAAARDLFRAVRAGDDPG
jgi:hypothetical protein